MPRTWTEHVRLVLDFTPIKFLDMSLEAIYKTNDYGDTVLGRTKDDRHQGLLQHRLRRHAEVPVMLFGDVEHVERDSYTGRSARSVAERV